MKRKLAREKIHAARKKLRTHLKHRGEKDDFEMTPAFCMYWWHRLNSSVFDGKLTPPVRFECRAFRDDSAGWCLPWRPNSHTPRVTIGIHTDMWDRKRFLNVLVHEMVHQWEWEVMHKWEPNIAHGARFFSWKDKLKQRAGLSLETAY